MFGIDFQIKYVIDILLVAGILYETFRLLRRSGAVNLFWGIMAFIIVWFLVRFVFQLELTSAMFDRIISVGAIALIVIFQEEIRTFSTVSVHASAALSFVAFVPNRRPPKTAVHRAS